MNATRPILSLLTELEQSGAQFPREAAMYVALRIAELRVHGAELHEMVVQRSGAISADALSDASPTDDDTKLIALRCLLVANPTAQLGVVTSLEQATTDAQIAAVFEDALRPLHRDAMERLLGRIAFAELKNPFVDPNLGLDGWAK